MPKPFEQFPMQSLEMLTKPEFRQKARDINANEKIGDLAHFLVHNFKSEISCEEHVIDTAIRLLKNKIKDRKD